MRATAFLRSCPTLLLALLALLGACALPPVSEPELPATARPATPTRTLRPTATATTLLEERSLGEAAELTPSLQVVTPTPTAAATPSAGAATPGAEAMATGTAAEPESLLTHITPTTPPNVVAALRLIEDGRQQMRQDRYDQAIDRFERAVAVDPTNAYGYYFLAQLHSLTKKYDQAIAFAGRAITLSARTDRVWQARAYALQGAVFENVGRYPDARKAYQKAIAADPSNLAAQVGAGRLSGDGR